MVPFAWLIRVITRTAAKDIAIEGVSIRTGRTSTSSRFSLCFPIIIITVFVSELVVRSKDLLFVDASSFNHSIRPAGTLRQ